MQVLFQNTEIMECPVGISPLRYAPSLELHRGFPRNVRRWCAEQGLVRDFCPDSQLEVEVAEGILEVGFFLSSTFHDYRFC